MARLTVDGYLEEKTIQNHHHDTMCSCRHRHAEHSAFGSCHGCSGCDEGDDLEAEHDHAYARCSCSDFQLAYHEIAASA